METLDLDKKLKLPHLLNLNEDPMLSGVLCHFLQAAVTIFGRADSQNPPSVILSGLKYVTNKMHSLSTINFTINLRMIA